MNHTVDILALHCHCLEGYLQSVCWVSTGCKNVDVLNSFKDYEILHRVILHVTLNASHSQYHTYVHSIQVAKVPTLIGDIYAKQPVVQL